MSPRRPLNYLRTNRKRLSLSQEDIAHLLGVEGGAKICRHEKRTREPTLRSALAYEIIYRKPIRELFGTLYEEIEKAVVRRAKAIVGRNDQKPANAHSSRKRKHLEKIINRDCKK